MGTKRIAGLTVELSVGFSIGNKGAYLAAEFISQQEQWPLAAA